ncbi:MAG: MCE family protein [Selenomonadaceae bacterium]|nr:MCE family protein [Selenomonadaceae bacterium]
MNAEAKVGAFTVGGLMALGASVMGLGNFNIGADNDYTLYAGFKQVIGLEPQAAVRLAGVPIGKVTNIGNDGGGVTVTMEINSKTQIPKDSTVMVTSSGVMGEKFINIMPTIDNGEYLKDGDYLYGAPEMGMDSMFEGLTKVLDKVDTLLASMNNIVGDPVVQKSMVDMSANLKDASEHMGGLMESLERMAKGNESNVNQMATQLNETLASMNRTMSSVENMAANIETFAADPETAENLRTTLRNISDTSRNIASMAENMNRVAGDPKTAEDMKATIHNARSLTERADNMLGKVEGAIKNLSNTEVTPSVDVLYSGKASDWNTNFNLDLNNNDTTLRLGIEDIGDGDRINAQIGKRFNNNLGARAGVISGKMGIGLDAYAGNRWRFSAEAYNPNDETLRLKSQYKLNDSTYILGEWHNVTDSDNRAAYFGLKREF